MTIKEMEQLSGMTRSNIRFYETEGLLSPARDPNGYRNYSEKDLEALKRIRLLRTLRLDLDHIRKAEEDPARLTGILTEHMRRLGREEASLAHLKEVCAQMCRDRVSYDALDAQHYLELLDAPEEQAAAELREDRLPRVAAPWRRFLARGIDLTLWELLWNAFFVFAAGFSAGTAGIFTRGALAGGLLPLLAIELPLSLLASNGAVLLAEPLFLRLTGTTPGKFCFGLKITGPDGRRLTYREAFRRTWTVLRKGCGFFLPVWDLVCMYRCYQACKREEYLDWEENSVLYLKKGMLPLGVTVFVLSVPADLCLTDLIEQASMLPPNRGALTRAEFCENFNALQDAFGSDRQLNLPNTYGIPDSALYLDPDGKWTKKPGAYYINVGGSGYAPLPELQFSESGGRLTRVSFSWSMENENITVASWGELMALAAVSWICAQDEYSLTSDPPEELFTTVCEKGSLFEDFSFTKAGSTVVCDFEYDGCEVVSGPYGSELEPVYGENALFRVDFSIQGQG